VTTPTQQWTEVYNAFNPFEPVPLDKMDAWFVERPQSPLPALLVRFDPRKVPQRTLLVGDASSGKTTELTKLAAELGTRYEYFVVRINLEQNLDIEKANPVEVIFLMGAAIYKVAQAELDRGPDEALFHALVDGLNTLVQTHTENEEFRLDVGDLLANLICFGATMIAGPVGGAAAQVATQVIRPFRFVSGTDTQVVRRLEVQPKIKEMIGHLNNLIADVQAKAERPLVLIVDGLDKVRFDVAALNFAENKFLAEPDCRVLYTAPMVVHYSPRFAAVRGYFSVFDFPNIKLHERDDREQRDRQGYATMRQVVYRRLNSLGLEPEGVITRSALDLLIQKSGGLMRDLIRLVQDSAVKAEIAGQERIDKPIAEEAVADLRRLYTAQLNPRYRKELEQVQQLHEPTGTPECDELLYGNFVLSYVNHDVWFDVHSILW